MKKKGLRVLSTAVLLGVGIASTMSLTGCKNKTVESQAPASSASAPTASSSASTPSSSKGSSVASSSSASSSSSSSSKPSETPSTTVPAPTTTTSSTTGDKVKVNYYTDGKTLDETEEVSKGSLITKKPTEEGKTFVGWYLDAEYKTLFDLTEGVESEINLYGRWENGVVAVISNVAELEAYRSTKTTVAKAILICDIDYEGYALEIVQTANYLAKDEVFDGEGHTIKNLSYQAQAAKVGCLFTVITEGVVKNVKFLNCSIISASESCGIITGLCEGATFENIEFNSCQAKTTNNYVGMLYARNTATGKTINVNGLTTKNGCKTECAQYGGFVAGDGVSGTTLEFNNMDIAGEFASTANGSFISGRTRSGINVSVSNTVIREAKVSTPDKTALFASDAANALTVENVVVFKSNASLVYNTAKAPSTRTITNSYTASAISLNEFAATATDSVEWLKDTLGLDFENTWQTEKLDNTKYLLIGASTNCKSQDAVITKMTVNYANAKVRYHAGEDFSTDGITVSATYSDGVQLVLTKDVDYTIDYSSFGDTKGSYEIKVISSENSDIVVKYNVNVVEQTGFKVSTEFADVTYLAGEKFSNKNVIVWSVWSDGVEERETSGYSINSSAFNTDVAGEYDIVISYPGFVDTTYKVSVIDTKPVVSQNYVYVNVNALSTLRNGELEDGVETFKTVSSAVDFLASCKYDENVIKVINVGAGTYNEKVEIPSSLANLHIIGASKESTIITYSAVESTVDVRTNSTYGLDCATVVANAPGFAITNIQIRNDFNYIRDNLKEASPQGLALTINGDGAVIYDAHLYGNQDTLYLKSGRTYIKDSLVEGNIDFIFGNNNGLAYFDNCEIKAISRDGNGTNNNTGYVTAMKATESDAPVYGYIFNNCNFTNGENVKDGSMSLGRPWGAKASVAYINCSFSKAYSTLAYDGKTKSRWFDMSGNKPQNANFVEYGSTGDGAITESVEGGKVLTAEEAANYTLANIFAATNGNVKWSGAWNQAAALENVINSAVGPTDTNNDLAIDAETININVGEEASLGVYVTPWNASNKAVTYEVLDSEIVSVKNGIVKALAEGETTVTVKYGDIQKVVNVVCEIEDTSKEIVKDTVLDFTTEAGFAAVKTANKITYTAENERFNTNNVQFTGTIEIPVKAGTKITIEAYDNSEYVNYTLGVKDATDLETKHTDDTFVATKDCVVVYKGIQGEKGNYIKKIVIDCPIEKSVSYAFGSKNDKGYTYNNVVASLNDITFVGNIGDHEDSIQIKQNASVRFVVPANTKVTVIPFAGEYGTLDVNGEILNGVNKTYTVTVATEFVITAVNVGTEEAPAYNQSYLVGLDIVLPNYVKKDTKITFGEQGNYKESALNTTNANLRDNGANNCEITGTISLAVKKGTKVIIEGYKDYTHYTIGTNGNQSEEITDENYTYVAANDEIVEIVCANGNYFYSISVSLAKESVAYTYTYGVENSSSWVEDKSLGTITEGIASDPKKSIKLVPGTYLTLNTESSTDATLALTGWTTGSSNASSYLKIELLDASGNVIKTLTGTSGKSKTLAPWTVDGSAEISVHTDTPFTQIRFTSNTDTKSVTIYTANITVKLA